MRVLVAVLLLLLSGCSVEAEPHAGYTPTEATANTTPPPAADAPAIRGITLDAREAPSQDVLRRLVDLGVTHVTLIPFGFQERDDDPNLRFSTEPNWFAESGRGARALAAAGDSLGFDVILKPQLWLGQQSDDEWSATIGFATEAEWLEWESKYRALILHHARVSAEIDAPLFVIGTELARAVREREAFWRSLIGDVRALYPGAITYAANWYEDFEHVPFWDALDYVAIQAYFPLAQDGQADLSVTALQQAWTPHKAAIQRVAEATGKPVLFTEVGYRSVGYAAREPWRWPERGETAHPDLDLQRDLYEALFTTFWHEPWFEGTIVWKWPYRPSSSRRDPGRRLELDFGIEGKPAEAVLAQWYGH